jgi:hypothetical protein
MPKMNYRRAIMSEKEVERKMAILAKCRDFVPSVVPIVPKPSAQPSVSSVTAAAPAVPAVSSIPRTLPPTIVTFN